MRWTRSRLIGILVATAILLALGCAFWLMRQPARVDMAQFVPESALAYVAIDSIPAIASGLTESDAWSRLSGPLGLSSQLEYAGPTAELLGKIGLGPDDAVALGRAQLAIVITGVEAGAGPTAENDESAGAIVIRPHFALVIKTHVSGRATQQAATARLPLFAKKAYGEQTTFQDEDYDGLRVTTASHPSEPRQIVWAVRDDVVVVGNQGDSVRAVLDTMANRAPSLARGFYFERLRTEVESRDSVIFAYFSKPGVGKVVGIGPGIIAGSLSSDTDRMASVSRLFGSITDRTVEGLAYSGRFERGRFVDRYFALISPRMADALGREIKPAEGEALAPKMAPDALVDLSLVRIQRPGESLDALITALSSTVDVSVAATVTQVAIELRRSYGVVAEQPVAPLLGDEVAFMDFGDGQPKVAIFEIRDEPKLIPIVERYLTTGGSRVSLETYKGFDVLKSTNEDGRAAAVVGRFLVLGTRDQIAQIVDAREAGGPWAEPVRQAIQRSNNVISASQHRDRDDAGELILAISGLLRTTDGNPELLGRDDVRTALDAIPPSVSVTTLRDGGIAIETTSAVGNLSFLTTFF